MANRPQVAIKIAECIAEWANIKSMLGIFLGFLLHSKAETALNMYMALDNRAAQLRLLESAAKSELSILQFDLFEVLMDQFLRPIMKTRDKFAHWCWGHSPQLPNDLLLIQPTNSLLTHYIALHGKPTDIDDEKVFVITGKYVGEFLKTMRKAQAYLATLITSVGVDGTVLIQDVGALDRLSNVPEFQKGLVRARAEREKHQAKPLRSHPIGEYLLVE